MMISQRILFSISIFGFILWASACALPPASGQVTPASSTQMGRGWGALTPTLGEVATSVATQAAAPGNLLRVVYAKDGNIWHWDASASPQRLTTTGQDSAPKISDDGLVVAFLRSGAMWAVEADGAHERILLSVHDLASLSHRGSSMARVRQFDFAPHSHDIYFNIELATASIPVPEDNLARVNADAPSLQALLDASQAGRQFIFSPDGTKIALPRHDQINVINADGSGLKTVFTFQPVTSDRAYIPDVLWLPDGSGFKTVIPAPDQAGGASALTRFMFIPADGGPAAQLAEFVASPVFANRPVISPDGAKVLYTQARGTNLELHIIDASTADQMYFSHAADTFGILGWAPDSSHVVYWLGQRSRAWFGPQQSEAMLLSDAPDADHFAWVDARSYFFVAHVRELRFGVLGQPSILIDAGLSESAFDFTLVH